MWLALTLNDDHAAYTSTNVSFKYLLSAAGDEAVQVSLVLPVAGPSAGGSLLNVSGQGFESLGGVFCRFGTEERTVPGTLVSGQLMLCRSPSFSIPLAGVLSEYGLQESVEVSLNGQNYTTSSVSFLAFDKANVHVSSLVPYGGPAAGGTLITVLGGGFADHNVHCLIGSENSIRTLIRGTVVNASALLCYTPARSTAAAEAVEVTLNGDVSSHTLTSNGVLFDFYDASAVRIDSIAPQGGPAEGGTLVVVRGAGCPLRPTGRRVARAPIAATTDPLAWRAEYESYHIYQRLARLHAKGPAHVCLAHLSSQTMQLAMSV